MARRKPYDMKGLKKSFQDDLDTEGRPSRTRPGAYNSGNEQQSELATTVSPKQPVVSGRAARPPSRPAPPAIPYKRPVPRTPPIPPPRPPGMPQPTTPTMIPGTSQPLVMPQYDPMGGVTGPMAPPAPGSSTQGYPAAPQPTDIIPPLTGPNSDRMAGNTPNTDPGQAWRNAVTTANPAPLPAGQSAAGAVGGAIADNVGSWMANQNTAGLPQQGPTPGGAPLPAPQSLLDMAPDWLKKAVPPFRNPF